MYQIEWVIEKRVVLFRGIGDISIADVDDGVQRLRIFMDEGIAPVHVLSDSRYVGKVPTDLGTMQKLMKKHDNAGRTVLIGGNAFTKFVSLILTRVSGGMLDSKNTFEEAVDFLMKIDLTMPQEASYQDTPPLSKP